MDDNSSKRADRDPRADKTVAVSSGGLLATIAGLGLLATALATGVWLGGGGAARPAAAPSSSGANQLAPAAGTRALEQAPIQVAPAQQAARQEVAVGGSAEHPESDPARTGLTDAASPAMDAAAAASRARAEAEPELELEAEPRALSLEDRYLPSGADTDAEGLTAAEEGRMGLPTLVFFHARWCHVCQEIAPEMNEIQAAYGDSVAFVKMNIDDAEGRPASQRYGVRGTPTFVMFDARGRRVQQFSGWPGRQQMTGLMESVMARQ